MRRGFTLIEIVLTLVISAILTVGAFRALEALYQRSARAQALTELSLRSQIALDQLAALLYRRIPDTVIGYDPADGGCQALAESDRTLPVLEWIAFDEAGLVRGSYDGFVDLAGSARPTLDTNVSIDANEIGGYNLIFAGSFDTGTRRIAACEGAYGWHGADSNLSYDINLSDDNANSGDLDINDSVAPDYIYEKYYLARGSYAVARSADINRSADCLDNNLSAWNENNDTLLLFYDYRPWQRKSFCADPKASDENRSGSVTILAEHVGAFRAESLNRILRLSLEMNRTVRGSEAPVHLSKQRGIF